MSLDRHEIVRFRTFAVKKSPRLVMLFALPVLRA